MTAKALERLRFPVEQSRGRRYPEPAHPYRSDFQRDRDRVIHARAFRRLEDKTQVFSAGFSDHFRNRLTHTIEVSQIARTVASSLGLDEDLTETLALAHDVGHPPFAHAGEDELDRIMQQFGDRFEHNLHSLRIVEVFEQRYARFPGLNLTFEVREGIVKHSRDFGPGESPLLDEYLPGLRPPLEAQLIDIADEIAYNTADLDDGFDAGFFSMAEIAAAVPRYADLAEAATTMYAGAPERIQFLECLRALINDLVTGLVEGTAAAASESGVQTVEDVRHFTQRLAALTGDAAQTNRELKAFLTERVYNSPVLAAERVEGVRMIRELFEALLTDPAKLPSGYEESGEPIHRQICDYMAGMTDGYCRRIHAQLTGGA